MNNISMTNNTNTIKKTKNFSSFTFKVSFGAGIIVLLTCIAIIFFIKAFFITESNSLSYKESSKADYTVKLKPNDFYDVDHLPSGMNYIASLIDKININFDYNFVSSLPVNYDTSYYIEGVTRVYGDLDKKTILYEKSDILLDKQSINNKDIMHYDINKNIEIDYAYFNNFVKSFKASYALSSVSDLTVVLHVISNGSNKTIDKPIKLDSKASVTIPLTEQTINIGIKSDNINNYNTITDDSNYKNVDVVCLIVFICFSLADIYVLYRLIILIVLYLKSRSAYETTLKRILKEYDSIIANVENNVDISKYQFVKLSSFEELKDVHDNLGNPILYNEVIPQRVSYFTIIKDDLLYRYILNASDIKRKRMK